MHKYHVRCASRITIIRLICNYTRVLLEAYLPWCLCIISRIQKKKTKKGDQFAFINIYGTSLVEGTVWPDALKKFQDLIVKGTQVAIYCKKEAEDKVIVDKMKLYSQWLEDTKHLRTKQNS